MTGLVNIIAEEYASKMTSAEEDLLQAVYAQTSQSHSKAHMLCGNLVGTFLTFLSRSVQAENILEIGTFTGYSALCLARGLQVAGKVHTIELREEDAATARAYFDQSVYAENIKLYVGDAKQIIPNLKEEWDIVFIDADKTGYIEYYELVLPFVKKNGFIIADNVLFHGQVLEPEISGKNAKAVDAFNVHVKNDSRVAQVLLTVRDGLLLIQKL